MADIEKQSSASIKAEITEAQVPNDTATPQCRISALRSSQASIETATCTDVGFVLILELYICRPTIF